MRVLLPLVAVLSVCTVCAQLTVPNEVTYVAAVIEYEPYSEWTEELGGAGVLLQNALNLLGYANDSKQQFADIFVAPEYGLQSLDMQYGDIVKFLTYTQYVPNPSLEMAPCTLSKNSSYTDAIRMLSCGAAELQIYLVIDLAELVPCSINFGSDYPWAVEPSSDCPTEGFFVYNTQVVFDRNGTVIARYRKIHLFLEPDITTGPIGDSNSIFVTDFDVAFSLQICFDLVYEEPGYNNVKYLGITDVAMSTAWVDELPFHIADVVQSGWSRGLGTNLLVSGYHKPARSKLGSGIFRGYSQELPVYSYEKNSGNVLLVSTVTTQAWSSRSSKSSQKPVGLKVHTKQRYPNITLLEKYTSAVDQNVHLILHEDLTNYASQVLESGVAGQVFETYACSNDYFCCHLSYEYSGDLTYMLLVYSGRIHVGYGEYYLGEQVCGIVWCRNEDKGSCAQVELGLPTPDTFGPFTLSSNSLVADQVFPSGLSRNLSLINNDELYYEHVDNSYSIYSNLPIEDPLAMALFGRWYSIDP